MSLKEETLLTEFKEHYKELTDETSAKIAAENLQRCIYSFNECLKEYVNRHPYASTIGNSEMRDIAEELEDCHIDTNISLNLLDKFLNATGYEELLDSSIPGSKYQMDTSRIKATESPLDEIIEDLELKETIPDETDLAEYVVADLSRKGTPRKSEIKQSMENRLGYTMTMSQIEKRLERAKRITADQTGGKLETSYEIEK